MYFLLKPNYKVLGKYFKLQHSVKKMNEYYSDGYPVMVDWYYTDEMVADIEQQFKTILTKYQIQQHYDNLMFIYLQELQRMETVMEAVNTGNLHRKMIKELAQLLLVYETTPESKDIHLSAKTFNNSVKISNQKLSLWIGKLIKETVESGKYLISDLGFETDSLLLDVVDGKKTLSIEKLKAASKLKLHDAAKEQKRLIAELCFFQLLPYLNGQTTLKKSENTNFSDAQLNFLFDTLVLFDLLPAGNFDKDMDYQPKDFMRNYLMKYARTLLKRETK